MTLYEQAIEAARGVLVRALQDMDMCDTESQHYALNPNAWREEAHLALDAILSAIASPSAEMVEAGMRVCYDQAPETIGIYQAMLAKLGKE